LAATPTIKKVIERRVPISSPIRNAYIDFTKMDVSTVAVLSSVERGGAPIVGYGFNTSDSFHDC
jgi:D(-)-tartrate dehydratase